MSLYDLTFCNSSICFVDFLKLAESNGISFVEDILNDLNIHAAKARQQRIENFEKLSGLFSRFLGRTFSMRKEQANIIVEQENGRGEVRAMELEKVLTEMSPGELMIFYLCIFLFYLFHIKSNCASLIVLIDEPELHLHPKVLTSLMRELSQLNGIAQIWIATHSLFAIPLIPFEELVYLKHGQVLGLNRHTYADIYDDLIGLENIDVYELLGSIENWENYRFVVENFFLPKQKSNSNKFDEQTLQLLKALRNIQRDRPLKILDYGAGKCRVYECLRLAIPDSKERARLLKYEAYDPFPPEKYPQNIPYHVSDANLKSGAYDAIALINVLHEIAPEDWGATFRKIYYLLAEDGVLVFLEVLSLTNGEQPYGQTGYLLLQNQQVKELFPDSSPVELPSKNSPKSNCWVIPRSNLNKIRRQEVIKAIASLECLCEHQLEEIDEDRVKIAHSTKTPVDADRIKQSARQYAFLAQQFINAHIAKKKLDYCAQSPDAENENPEEKIPFPGFANS